MSDTSIPPSLWTETAVAGEDYPTLDGDVAADVAIVGGGFTGLSAALHLAERGCKPVVLEAAEAGFGASGRNGGQVIPGLKYDPRELAAMFGAGAGGRMAAAAGAAADLVFELIDRHGIDCEARQAGWIQPAHIPRMLAIYEARARDWQAHGAPVELLDGKRTAELIGGGRYLGGWLDRRAGTVQPLSYARGLARAAAAAGARIVVGSRATGLARVAEDWRLTTARGRVTAPAALLATNGYTDGLWPGLAETVVPLYSMQVATRPLTENLRRTILPGGHAVSDSYRLLRYYRTDAAGRLIMGGRGPFEDRPAAADAGALIGALRNLFPQLGEPEIDLCWAGRVAITADHLPHLNHLAPGLYAGLGYNGRGVAMATLMGRLLADLAAGVEADDIPFPVTPPKRVALHALRRPAIALLLQYFRLRDRLEGA